MQERIHVAWRTLSPIRQMAIASFALSLFAVCLPAVLPFPTNSDTAIYLYREDRWLLPVQCILLLVVGRLVDHRHSQLHIQERLLVLYALGLFALCYAGSQWVLFGYPLSRDEQMAVFDSRIFRSGLLVQQLPQFWQMHAGALNTSFMLPVVHPIAWVSDYLPMNAALRAFVGLFADPALTGPLMVALGMVALWKCARLLWPDDREAAVVALLLYVGSGQVLFASMTAYAMPAHLALNLLWLWCFLLNRRMADVAALLVAFVATGLHQPLFHPLFAAPILFLLVLERNWPRLALYAIGYGAICAFWLAWPIWMQTLVTGPNSIAAIGGTDYLSRLLLTLSKGDPARWQNMAANLFRFFAWQHLLLLPLILAGVAVVRRERLAGAFAAAVILPVCIMLVILPYQGHGFGYRYLHGVIGCAILLAVYGWRQLVADSTGLRSLVVRTTLAGLIVILPLQAWMAYTFYGLYARIDRRVNLSGADYFIIGRNVSYSDGLVINWPDISNRPIRLLGEEVDDALIRSICRPGVRVIMPTSALLRPIEKYFVLAHSTKADAQIADLSPRLRAAGCTVERIDAP